MTAPAPTPPTTPTGPTPPAWLRGLGLAAYALVVVADAADGRLDIDGWALMTGAGLIIWGPPVLRSVFRRE